MQRGATCRDRGWCRWLRGGVPSLSHQRPAKTHRTWQPEGTSERALFCILEDQEAQATVLRASPPSLTLSCHPPSSPHSPSFWNVVSTWGIAEMKTRGQTEAGLKHRAADPRRLAHRLGVTFDLSFCLLSSLPLGNGGSASRRREALCLPPAPPTPTSSFWFNTLYLLST